MLNNLLITSDVTGLIQDFLQGYKGSDNVSEDLINRVSEQLDLVAKQKHLSFEHWWQMLEVLQQALGEQALGLKIGEFVKVEYFGCLGYLLKSSRDLEQALSCFERFQRLLYDGNKASLVIEPDDRVDERLNKPEKQMVAKLVWQADYGYSNQLSDELLISGMLTLARLMLDDQSIYPLYVDFPNTVAPELFSFYEEYFHCPVRFGQPNLTVVFPARYFSLPISGSDQHLYQLLSSQAENLLVNAPNAEQDQDSFLADVRKVLIRALQEGEPTAEVVAKHFHMSVRNLHRKLASHQVVFRDVLKDTRKLLAKQYLQDKKLTMPEVALMLGYSEQSAFSRAFKQWFDITPLQFVKSQSQSPR